MRFSSVPHLDLHLLHTSYTYGLRLWAVVSAALVLVVGRYLTFLIKGFLGNGLSKITMVIRVLVTDSRVQVV